MILLPNVKIDKMSPQILLGITILERLVGIVSKGKCEMTITSQGDGKHGLKSLHYPNAQGFTNAVDIRIKDLDGNINSITETDLITARKVVEEFKKRADAQFDIVLEKDHIHLEYDPK